MDKNKIYLYMSRWAFHGGAPGLGLFSFDTETGELMFLRHLNETISLDPTYLDEEKKILYICNEANLVEEAGYDTGRVYGYRMDPADGSLTELFRQDTFCPYPDYINFTPDKKFMIVPHHSWATGITNIEKDAAGNYVPVTRWMDSAIDLFRMNPDGTVDKLVDVKKHRFDSRTKDYENKVTVPHPHCAVRSPSGKLFAVCDKGDCHVYMYAVDAEKQELKLLSRTMSDAPLSESRYCAFHPTKPFFFVNHEHSAHGKMIVSAFRYDEEGTLTFLNKVDCLPEGEKADCGQGFCISKDGKYLYNLLNGYNAVAVLEINQETGEISVIQRIPVEGTHPRICALSPDGRFLLTTCLGGEIAVYRVGENGLLTRTEHNANLRGSAYITFFDPHK